MDFSGNGGREVTYYKNVKLKDSPLFLKFNIIAINKLRELFLDYFPITFYILDFVLETKNGFRDSTMA